MNTRLTSIITVTFLTVFALGALAGDSLESAIERFETGETAQAKPYFESALAADSRNDIALYYLGRIVLAEDDCDGAIDYLQAAVDIDEANSNYRTWLGRAYIAKLRTVSSFERGVLAGRALDNLTKAVELDPGNVEARVSLGGYYLNAPSIAGGSKRKAQAQAQEVVKYDALQGNEMLAQIHIKYEEYDEAIDKIGACIEAKPDNVEYRYQLGMLYQKLERYDEAFDVFEGVLAMAPDNRAALYQIGRTSAMSATNTDRGIECLKAYLTLDVAPGYPGYDGAHWRLGQIFEHKGELGAARTEYETAMRINPDEDRYRDALNTLEESHDTARGD